MKTRSMKRPPRPMFVRKIRIYLWDDIDVGRPSWTKTPNTRFGAFLDKVDPKWTGTEKLAGAFATAECFVFGHLMEDDMCGKPEHRYCVYCQKRAEK